MVAEEFLLNRLANPQKCQKNKPESYEKHRLVQKDTSKILETLQSAAEFQPSPWKRLLPLARDETNITIADEWECSRAIGQWWWCTKARLTVNGFSERSGGMPNAKSISWNWTVLKSAWMSDDWATFGGFIFFKQPRKRWQPGSEKKPNLSNHLCLPISYNFKPWCQSHSRNCVFRCFILNWEQCDTVRRGASSTYGNQYKKNRAVF